MTSDTAVKWQVPAEMGVRNISGDHWQWLSHEGSLTARFYAELGENISFQLVKSHWSVVFDEELPLLGLANAEQHWVREIKWNYQQQCWVVARAVIPGSTSSPIFQNLLSLGQQSIGKQLFSSPEITKGAIEVAKLSATHPYFALAKPWMLDHVDSVWARRRTFSHAGDSILVAELFLPSFFQYDFECKQGG